MPKHITHAQKSLGRGFLYFIAHAPHHKGFASDGPVALLLSTMQSTTVMMSQTPAKIDSSHVFSIIFFCMLSPALWCGSV